MTVAAVILGLAFLSAACEVATPSSFPAPADLPAQPALPDVMMMLDGRKVTTREMWMTERRPELIRLFQHYMYGQLPPKPVVSASVARVDTNALGGKATLREVTLKCGRADMPPIHLMVIVPNSRTRPASVVLSLNYFGNHTLVHDPGVRLSDSWMPERGEGVVANRSTEASRGTWTKLWPVEEIIDRGYALATFYNGDIQPDSPELRLFSKYFPTTDPADECGTIGAWAWSLQRAVDYLVTDPAIDARKIAVTGHSRTGKAALVAAAFDERIAMALPHQAGCGGSAPSRARLAIGQRWNTLDGPQRKPPETVADINDKFPHWFNARFKEFNSQPGKLPFDQHCLLALCAPRPVLFSNGRADTWINPAGQFEVMKAAASAYRLLGAGDFTPVTLSADGEIVGDRLGYYLRPGAHSLLRGDWMAFLDFADRHFGAPEKKTAQAAVGPILIDPEHPNAFRFQSGEHFFPMGDTAYFLIAQPTNVIARYLDLRREHGFNFIRAMAMVDGFWPFGGTDKSPEYDVIHDAALKKWDWVFDYAAARGMNLELILWGYGVAGGEGLWGDQKREDLWIRTIVNRFKDRSNLFMWTVANEFERYPDGKYVYQPGDVSWARNVAARIRELDAVHPIGCHPSVWITDQGEPGKSDRPFARYGDFTQRRPQLVWPLWQDSAVNLLITQNNEGVHPRTWGNVEGSTTRGVTYFPARWRNREHPAHWTPDGWDLYAAGLEESIAEDWSHGKPVLNSEFGYQREPGYETHHSFATRQCHSPDTVRRKAWKIVTAGGYFAAGFESTAVRNFTVADAANFRPGSLQILRDFFSTLPYWRMRPVGVSTNDAAVLAEPGRVLVAYCPRGGQVALEIPAADQSWIARWFNPRAGRFHSEERAEPLVAGTSRHTFPAPDTNDWVLLVQRAELKDAEKTKQPSTIDP